MKTKSGLGETRSSGQREKTSSGRGEKMDNTGAAEQGEKWEG